MCLNKYALVRSMPRKNKDYQQRQTLNDSSDAGSVQDSMGWFLMGHIRALLVVPCWYWISAV